MSNHRARKQETQKHEPAEQRRLRSIPGGKQEAAGLEKLFSSTVTQTAKKRSRKGEVPPVSFSPELAKIADLYAAGKAVEKEIEFKVSYANQRVREYCTKNLVHLFAKTKRKPPSIDYVSPHAKFKFVQTHRATLTSDKADTLRNMNIPIDNYTELSGIEVNMSEIRRHGLEDKLREGLSELGVPNSVLEECFIPKRELNPAFFDNLSGIVGDSLEKGEDLEEKMYEVVGIVNPAQQIRNVETKDLPVEKAFDLILNSEIETEDEI